MIEHRVRLRLDDRRRMQANLRASDHRSQDQARRRLSRRHPGRDGRGGIYRDLHEPGQERGPAARSWTSWPRRRTATRPSWSGSSATISPSRKLVVPAESKRPKAKVAVDEATAVLGLFKLAMTKEKEAEKYYKDAKAQVDDPESKKILEYLRARRTQPLLHAQVGDRPAGTVPRLLRRRRRIRRPGPFPYRRLIASTRGMPMESAEKRLPGILKILEKTYPAAETCLTFRTPWELLVATVLSAQCTDERVNKVTPGLFAKFPDVAAFAGADQASLEAEIRSDRLLPQQVQEPPRRRAEADRRIRRPGPRDHGRAHHPARRGPQNGQHRPVLGFSESRGHRRGRPRGPDHPAIRA